MVKRILLYFVIIMLLVSVVSRYVISPWVKNRVIGLYERVNMENSAPTKAPPGIPQIKDYAVSSNFPPIHADLNGDGTEETIVAYYGTTQGRTEGCNQTEPVLLKIYSGNSEAFSLKTSSKDTYNFNEISHLSVETDLGGKTYVFFGEDVSGCGSGYQGLNYFISHHPETKDFKADINLPSSELSNIFIKDFSASYAGREILITRAVWDETESHFEAHRQGVEVYYWNGKYWNQKDFGNSKNKHFDLNGGTPETVDQFLSDEPLIATKLKSL